MKRRFAIAGPMILICGGSGAQPSAGFEAFAGNWEGYVTPVYIKLQLALATNGRFSLTQITPGYNTSVSGQARRKGDAVVVPLDGGETVLSLTTDGKLSGPFHGVGIRGSSARDAAILSRK